MADYDAGYFDGGTYDASSDALIQVHFGFPKLLLRGNERLTQPNSRILTASRRTVAPGNRTLPPAPRL